MGYRAAGQTGGGSEYAATPHSGTNNRKDPAPTSFEIADVNGDGVLNFYDISAYIEAFTMNQE